MFEFLRTKFDARPETRTNATTNGLKGLDAAPTKMSGTPTTRVPTARTHVEDVGLEIENRMNSKDGPARTTTTSKTAEEFTTGETLTDVGGGAVIEDVVAALTLLDAQEKTNRMDGTISTSLVNADTETKDLGETIIAQGATTVETRSTATPTRSTTGTRRGATTVEEGAAVTVTSHEARTTTGAARKEDLGATTTTTTAATRTLANVDGFLFTSTEDASPEAEDVQGPVAPVSW